MNFDHDLIIVGSGPAALIAAFEASTKGLKVALCEKNKSLANKLLIAGKSGLNITNNTALDQWPDLVSAPKKHLAKLLSEFSPQQWLKFINKLGIETFLGSSGRYFTKELKAGRLVKIWISELKKNNVTILTEHELNSITSLKNGAQLGFANKAKLSAPYVLLCLGGASWLEDKNPPSWKNIFTKHKIKIEKFESANAGFEVDWSEGFKKECQFKPLKNILLKTKSGKSYAGELMITDYGLEGTPIYNLRKAQIVYLDLKPQFTLEQIIKKLSVAQKNQKMIRKIKSILKLSDTAHALIFHHSHKPTEENTKAWAQLIKSFPIKLTKQRPLSEAISSSGGIAFSELSPNLEFKKIPGVYCAGEMINWDAPTGGYLIQTCVSQGHLTSQNIIKRHSR